MPCWQQQSSPTLDHSQVRALQALCQRLMLERLAVNKTLKLCMLLLALQQTA